MAVQAVLCNLIVIEKATVKIPTDIQERLPKLPWRLMSDMSNLSVHDYFRVDPEIVWDTVQDHISRLIEPLQKLLDSEEII